MKKLLTFFFFELKANLENFVEGGSERDGRRIG